MRAPIFPARARRIPLKAFQIGGSNGKDQTNLVLRRSIKLFPNVDICLALDPLDRNSSRALQHCRLDTPIRLFTLKVCEPVC
jgi:hypothetical protein